MEPRFCLYSQFTDCINKTCIYCWKRYSISQYCCFIFYLFITKKTSIILGLLSLFSWNISNYLWKLYIFFIFVPQIWIHYLQSYCYCKENTKYQYDYLTFGRHIDSYKHLYRYCVKLWAGVFFHFWWWALIGGLFRFNWVR